MPRKNLIRTDQFPYHITIRSNNRDWFELPLEEMWDICKQGLKHAHQAHPSKVEAFVLMSNHYHLLIWTPKSDVDRFMYELNSYISKIVRFRTKRINRIFGDRYKWTLVDQQNYYKQVLRYIYQNPLKAGLVIKCELYPYSTLAYIASEQSFEVPIYNESESLRLLKDGYFEKELDKRAIIAKALSRSKFNFPKVNSSRRAI